MKRRKNKKKAAAPQQARARGLFGGHGNGPASSSAAAALMASRGGSTGFIGFGAFSDGAVSAAMAAPATAPDHDRARSADGRGAKLGAQSQPLCPFYPGPDEALALALKRLSKKDATTRLKALQQLEALVAEPARSA